MIALLLALAQDAFTPLGEGLIDAAGSTLYVAGPEGKIVALDAASGRVKRAYESAGRPIALAGAKLAVEAPEPGAANAVRLVVFDAEGKVLSTSDAIRFPEWVSTSPANGRHFRSSARVERGVLIYDWRAGASYPGGPNPPPEIEKAARKSAAGEARMNLETYAVTTAEAEPELPKERGGAVRIGTRTYSFVEDGATNEPSGRLRADRRLTCTSSDPAEPGWTYALRPRYLPPLIPSAPPLRR